MSDIVDKKIESLQRENESLKSTIRWIPGEDGSKYKKYLENLEELFNLTGVSIHLINISRAEKRMYGNFTPLAKKSAIRSFEKNKNEKTLYFLLETAISNMKPEKAKNKLEEVFRNVKNDNLKIIKNIYMAGIASREGDFFSANKLLYSFKEGYSGKVLWQSDFIITDYDTGLGEVSFLGNGDDVGDIIVRQRDELADKYIISISCNRKYFDLYGEAFLASVKRNCQEEAFVHISFVNVDEEYVKEKIKEWGRGLNVAAKFIYVDDDKEVAVSATARVFVINSLLEKFRLPVFFCEIDGVVIKNFTPLINRSRRDRIDHVVRAVGSVLPWRMFTCGFGLFLPTRSGIKASGLARNYCKGIFNNHDRLVWADQAILEGVIRFSSLVDGAYKVSFPPMSEIKEYIFTPTGSHEKKQVFIKNLVFNEKALD